MKFTCNTKDIAAAVGAASKVVNAHTTVPILSNVLLEADGGKIAVREIFLINGRLFDGLQSRTRKQHGIRRDHSIKRRIDFGTGRSGMGAGNQQRGE